MAFNRKNIPNPSTGRGEYIEYDSKQLRRMSADELREYYDRIAPISDEEVKEAYDRIIPKLEQAIAAEIQKEQSRRVKKSIAKTALIAVCLTLMLSFMALAFKIPVWDRFLSWTQDNFQIGVSHTNTADEALESYAFSEEEIATWGENVCAALADIGVFPDLPTYMPDGFTQCDLYFMTGEDGYSYIDVLYEDSDGHSINLSAEIQFSADYASAIYVEHDNMDAGKAMIDDITYQFASNISNNTVSWNNQYGLFYISGNIDMTTLEKMIQTMR